MKVNVFCAAFDPEQLQQLLTEPVDEVVARIHTELVEDYDEEEEDEQEELELLLQQIRNILDPVDKLQMIRSEQELDALGVVLQHEADLTPLYELQGWSSNVFQTLCLGELTSSTEVPLFKSVDVSEPYRLQYFTNPDLQKRILPAIKARRVGPRPPEFEAFCDHDPELWNRIHDELEEVLESISDDKLDAILITALV